MAFPDQTNETLTQLKRIADALERLANGGEPTAPDMRKPIETFKTFDWSSIGAAVINQDADGATMVEYAGTLWTRRSPQNKFDPAIWFSRASGGKDADGNVKYLRLITFQTIHDADPLPAKARQAAGQPMASTTGSAPAAGTITTKPTPEENIAAFTTWATSPKYGLPKETAAWLLGKMVGDIDKARALVPILAEGRAGGLDGKTLGELLASAKNDPTEFMVLVRNNTKHTGQA